MANISKTINFSKHYVYSDSAAKKTLKIYI